MKKNKNNTAPKSPKSLLFVNVLLYKSRKSTLLEEGTFSINSHCSETLSQEEVIEMACDRRGIKPSEMEAALQDFFATLENILKKGRGFHTEWVYGDVRAKGILLDENEEFNPRGTAGHSLGVNINFTRNIIDDIVTTRIPIKRDQQMKVKPNIQGVYDFYTKTDNVLILGAPAVITGDNFKMDDADTVKLVLTDSNDVKYEITDFKAQTANELHLQMPEDIPAGQYRLRILCEQQGKYKEDTHEDRVTVKE